MAPPKKIADAAVFANTTVDFFNIYYKKTNGDEIHCDKYGNRSCNNHISFHMFYKQPGSNSTDYHDYYCTSIVLSKVCFSSINTK
jgi:hypothetical protein